MKKIESSNPHEDNEAGRAILVRAKRQINTRTKTHVVLSVIAAIGEHAMNPVTDVVANIQLLFHHQLAARIGKEQIARAYAMLKNDTESQCEYAAFFRVWKDADPSLPIFRRAHREYDQIKSGTSRI